MKNNIRKKLIIFTSLVFIALSGWVFAGISGTSHDLRTRLSTTQICDVCHTPHNSTSALAPLWNHQETAQSFNTYTSSTLDGAISQPGGASKACLGCHDGTVALENYGSTTTGTDKITGTANVGTDLSNDHPVSVEYTTGDPGLWPAGGATMTLQLFSNKVECASCHSVHDNANGKFLVVTNTGNALCFKCHNK